MKKSTYLGVFSIDDNGKLALKDLFHSGPELEDSLKITPGRFVVLPVVVNEEIQDLGKQPRTVGEPELTEEGKPGLLDRILGKSKSR